MEDRSIILQLERELPIGEAEIFSLKELKEKWGQYFNSLIENDFQKLVGLLYRIDVPENKLRHILRENPGENAGDIIASLVIERLLQKIRSREEYRSKHSGMEDDPDAGEW
jgi:hypothetical protein